MGRDARPEAWSLAYLLSFAILVLSACSSSTPAVVSATEPSAPIPATQPLATSTGVSLAPSGAPVATRPATGPVSGTGNIFSAALEKLKTATSYRVEMEISGQGNLGLTGSETPPPDATPLASPTQEITLMSVIGEVNGKSAHFTMQGLFAAFLGIDTGKSLQVISTGENNYIHGPVPLLGANEDKWYLLPPNQASVAKPPLTPDTFMSSFTSTGLNPDDFPKTGSETLDNRTCDVYSGDKAAVEKTFQSISQTTGIADLSVIDAAEFQFWLCDDAFLHQIRMNISGHSQNKPDQKGTFLMLMHVSDFGSNISIQAPENAEPLSTPAALESPTP